MHQEVKGRYTKVKNFGFQFVILGKVFRGGKVRTLIFRMIFRMIMILDEEMVHRGNGLDGGTLFLERRFLGLL